ncbi:CYTH and CHAD domain-containing protein [Corynebacterium pacaense]|uniref:CYTH and CHAD domain-containing protein n=1 Tax=Corynebacterium pacaense TaxID=1816684 RepID=UPI0009BB4CFE|nr:CYTH and CHAD domain-containing protein [Corynebacterium pacaense]
MRRYMEIETKFSVSASTGVPDLTAIAWVDRVGKSETHLLSAIYFDTVDLRLTRSKITLRRRTGGNDAGWHIKFPGEVGREELQVPLDEAGGDEHTVPREILGQVRAIIRGAGLNPIARVDNERHTSYLEDEEGTEIAEFCDDHVSTESFLPGGARQMWREWELELTPAVGDSDVATELMASAIEVLTAAGGYLSESPSKLVSALGTSINNAPHPPEMADLPKGSPARAVLKAIKANADKIVEYDPKVRADEFDSVHQMRVATRELRSHMQTFEGILGGTEYLQLEKELKALASVLGRARDAEVIEERLTELLNAEDETVVDEATRAELIEDLGRVYQREWARVIRSLDDDRYTNLLQSLEQLLSNPPLVTNPHAEPGAEPDTEPGSEPQAEPGAEEDLRSPESGEGEVSGGGKVKDEKESGDSRSEEVDAAGVLLAHLDKAHSKLVKLHKKAVKEWNEDVPVAEREENFHNVRKAVKKLRYSAEAVGDATEVNTKKLYKACSRLQSVLGDFQDAVTSRDEILHRAKRAHRSGLDTFVYGVLYQREQALSRDYLKGYADAYTQVAKAYKALNPGIESVRKKSRG